jgi:hypothetical protein
MQDIGRSGKEQPHLVGQETAVGGAIAGQIVLDHLDEVLDTPSQKPL